jgi:type IV pilus assembly protein PilE
LRTNSWPGKRRARERNPASIRGITLMELMIVVAIIGLMLVLATPAYLGYSQRVHRTEAMSALTRLYADQENYRNVHHTYTNDLTALGFPGGCSENCVYTISFDVAPDTRTFTARAVPTAAGGSNGVNQTRDDKCSWFTIDARGVKSAADADCWGSQ